MLVVGQDPVSVPFAVWASSIWHLTSSKPPRQSIKSLLARKKFSFVTLITLSDFL